MQVEINISVYDATAFCHSCSSGIRETPCLAASNVPTQRREAALYMQAFLPPSLAFRALVCGQCHLLQSRQRSRPAAVGV